ncbi:MAG TPA: sigma-70 family RNA polymerase sigma factor [Planctomycetota bacterium]|nr:sigma-70 family RNA polymerase sigma factor [Planctomycetota bacterium]
MAHPSLHSEERPIDPAGLSDNELMTRLKEAPPAELAAGFEVLVQRYKNAIVSFLFRFVGDPRTAEDLAQEAFLRVFRKIADYNSTAKFSTWLYTIASNLAKDEFKRRSRHPAGSLDWESTRGADTTRNVPTAMAADDPGPEEDLELGETRERVATALKRLKEDDREILVLKDVQGLAYEEIAHILDLPMGTVKSRISRARLAFKDAWKRMGSSGGLP